MRVPMQHNPQEQQTLLLDHRGLDWSTITRTRYHCHQRFLYRYPGPIRDLHQRLIVVPPERYGDQVVVEHGLSIAPHTGRARQYTDWFGNEVWDVEVEHVDHEIVFDVDMMVERTTFNDDVVIKTKEAERFLQPTRLTAADEQMVAVAHELGDAADDPEDLAERISAWVTEVMQYGSGATTVETTAPQALTIGKGLCQDYAHIMLALCRALGLAARYVSGHMLADGGSHAWVEVLLPRAGGDFRALAFDPTNRRRPNLSYTTVAVGRDYQDVAPTSGRFTAPYGGQLSFTKRAQLTLIEHRDGTIIEGAKAALG